MNLFRDPEDFVLKIATLGPLGFTLLGRLVAPLFAIPVVVLGRYLYMYSKDLFYVSMFVLVLVTVAVVSFAYSSLPIERRDCIVLPLVPGMAEALLHVPMVLKLVLASFVLFLIIHAALEKLVDKIIDEDDQVERIRNRDKFGFGEDDIAGSEAYVLPPNRQKSVYEVLMLPIGSGVITSFLIHAILIFVGRL